MKIWNFGLLTCLKKLYHLLVGWIGNQDSGFPKTFHSLSLSEKESAVSESARSMYLLDKNQPRKYEILAVKFLGAGEKIEISICIGWFCLKEKLHEQKLTQQFLLLTVNGCGKFHQNLNHGFQFSLLQNAQVSLSRQEGRNFKFHRFVLSKKKQFWGDWIWNQESVFPKTFHGTSLSEQETAMSIFCSRNLFFSQNQLMKFEILTLLTWLNQIGTIFPGLNWKSGVSFPPNFPWHFSVRTGNCYFNLLLK